MSPGRTLSTPAWRMTVWHNDDLWLCWLNNMWRCASWFRTNNDRLRRWRSPSVFTSTTSRATPRWLHDHSGWYHWLHHRRHHTTSRHHRHTRRRHTHRHPRRRHTHRHTRRCHTHRHTRASRATPRWLHDHGGCRLHHHTTSRYHRHTRRRHTHRPTRASRATPRWLHDHLGSWRMHN